MKLYFSADCLFDVFKLLITYDPSFCDLSLKTGSANPTTYSHFTIMKVPRFESRSFSKVSSKTLVKSINADMRLGDQD